MNYFKGLLKRFHLLSEFEIEIKNRASFINQLKMITCEGYYHPLLFIFDYYNKSPLKYIGQVNNDGFKIRDKFDSYDDPTDVRHLLVRGLFHKVDSKITLKISIKGMSYIQLIFHLLISFVCIIGFILLVTELILNESMSNNEFWGSYIIPMILFPGFVIFFNSIGYNMAKNQLKSLENDFKETLQLIDKNVLQQGL